MYEDLTDIWVRYRVTRIRVKATFYPTQSGNTDPMFGVMYPYRATSSGIPDIDTVMSLPGAKFIPLPFQYS